MHVVSVDPDVATTVKITVPVDVTAARKKRLRGKIGAFMLSEQDGKPPNNPLTKNKIAEGTGGNKSDVLAERESCIIDRVLRQVAEGTYPKYTWQDPF
jgi:hypothetical protein